MSPNLELRVGEAFPIQDIRWIRSIGSAYGIHNAETCPMSELDYVEVRSERCP